MAQQALNALEVLSIDEGRIAIRVAVPADSNLQFVYRAGLSIYWDPGAGLLVDRHDRERSQTGSFTRISRALREEMGLRLRASGKVRWDGIEPAAREVIENEIVW